MDKSKLTLEHDVDCLRNELARLNDQEARILKNKKLVLEQILRTRRELHSISQEAFHSFETRAARIEAQKTDGTYDPTFIPARGFA